MSNSAKGGLYLYGRSKGSLRLGGHARGNKLLYREIYKIATGTDITILDTKDDQGRISGFECASVQNKIYFNALLNSNFVNTTSWFVLNSAMTVANNIATITGTGTGSNVSIFNDMPASAIANHKIYVRAKSTVTNSVATNVAYKLTGSTAGTANDVVVQATPTANTQYDKGLIMTVPIDATGKLRLFLRTYYPDNATANGKITNIKDVLVIDLTAQYGAGNEPNLAYCDANITYDKCWAMDISNTIYSSGDGGVLNAWSHKKNMLPNNLLSPVVTRGITITPNVDGTYTVNGTATSTGVVGTLYTNSLDKIKMLNGNSYTMSLNIINGIFPNGGTITFSVKDLLGVITYNYMNVTNTIKTSTKLMTKDLIQNGVGLYVTNGDVYNNVKIGLQLEQNTVATSYEPYTGADYPITLPVGYVGGSLPNGVKDTDLLKKVGKVVLNGSESWTINWSDTTYISFYINYFTPYFNTRCDKFQLYLWSPGINTLNTEGFWSHSTASNGIKILKSRLATQNLEGFKNWLASNNVTVYYELATPIDVSASIQKPTVNTYKDYCVVSSTNPVKPNLTVKYLEK